jgi:hypothetical protein
MNENQQFSPPENDFGQPPVRQSGAGIASFVLSVLAALGLLSAMVIATNKVMEYIDPATGTFTVPEDQLQQELLPALGGVVLLVPLVMLFTVISIILGIVALTQRDRKKGFGIAGLVIGGMLALLFLFILLSGFSAIG